MSKTSSSTSIDPNQGKTGSDLNKDSAGNKQRFDHASTGSGNTGNVGGNRSKK